MLSGKRILKGDFQHPRTITSNTSLKNPESVYKMHAPNANLIYLPVNFKVKDKGFKGLNSKVHVTTFSQKSQELYKNQIQILIWPQLHCLTASSYDGSRNSKKQSGKNNSFNLQQYIAKTMHYLLELGSKFSHLRGHQNSPRPAHHKSDKSPIALISHTIYLLYSPRNCRFSWPSFYRKKKLHQLQIKKKKIKL